MRLTCLDVLARGYNGREQGYKCRKDGCFSYHQLKELEVIMTLSATNFALIMGFDMTTVIVYLEI